MEISRSDFPLEYPRYRLNTRINEIIDFELENVIAA